MFLFIGVLVVIFLLALVKQVDVAKEVANGVVTSICYVGLMLFIVITFTRSFRKSIK